MVTRALTLVSLLSLALAGDVSGAARNVEGLKGLTAFGVLVEIRPSPGTPSYMERSEEQLQAAAEARLREAGLPVDEVRSPHLRVRIVSGGDDHGTIMYGVELDFLQEGPEAARATHSETWRLHSMGLVDHRVMPTQVRVDLEHGLEAFVLDWLSVNRKGAD